MKPILLFLTLIFFYSIDSFSKNNSGNGDIGKTQTPDETFTVGLYFTEANNIRHIADQVMVRYNNNYSAAVDWDDAEEINNWDENIAISRGGTRLAIESRPLIIERDTIPLFMNNMRTYDYEFEFTPSQFSNTSLTAELIDNYLNSRTLLSVTSTVTVPFSVNLDEAGSFATNRFMVVFATNSGSPLPITMSGVKAYEKNSGIQIEWILNSEQDMDRYEIERSGNGHNFEKAGTILSMGNSNMTINYGWLDTNPLKEVNFYRIKSIEKSGSFKYSNIIRVTTNSKISSVDINIYPNPIVGNGFNLQLNKFVAGKYTISIYNKLGQAVYTNTLVHAGGSATQYIDVSKELVSGTYIVKINGNETEISRTIIKK